MQVKASQRLFAEAQKYIPGGVNSPVRSFRAVEGTPLFITRGEGARIWDADGNEFIDYVGSWGPLVLGHAHPAVLEALRKAAEKGVSFGAPGGRGGGAGADDLPGAFLRWRRCGWSTRGPKRA